MKALTTAGLTKLIQLIKSSFISVDDTVETTTVTLADVATTGDYDDLINKPTIPSTDNLANKDLSNLTTNGNDRLHALKGYLDEGELLTDSEGLSDVTSYAHSTFDVSKFTKVGSPTITNDGILYPQTVTDKVTTSTLTISGNSLEIDCNFIYHTVSANRAIFWANTNARVMILSSNVVQLYGLNSYFTVPANNFKNGDNVKIRFIYESSTSFKYECYNNGILVQSGSDTVSVTLSAVTSIDIGGHSTTDGYIEGSIDLKQFSITVDGVPVFSGNKTGTDTIQVSNFTAVTSSPSSPFVNPSLPFSDNGLVITANGIVSGLTDSNSINTGSFTLSRLLNHSWSIVSEVIDADSIPENSKISPISLSPINESGGSGIDLYNGYSFTLTMSVTPPDDYSPEQRQDTTMSGQQNLVTLPSKIKVRMDFDYPTGTYTGYYDIFDGQGWQIIDTITPYTEDKQLYDIVYNNNIGIGVGAESDLGNVSINLNAFEVYIDGSLAYQPSQIVIPYTLSKTGSKIVDSAYRSQVSAVYQAYGYAPYYTLSSTDFTIPQGELYGMFGNKSRVTIRDWSVNNS